MAWLLIALLASLVVLVEWVDIWALALETEPLWWWLLLAALVGAGLWRWQRLAARSRRDE